MDHSSFDFPLDPVLAHDTEPNDPDAEEAALEAIRVAINNNNNNNNSQAEHVDGVAGPSSSITNEALLILSNDDEDTVGSTASAQVEHVIQTLRRLDGSSSGTLEGMGFAGIVGDAVRTLEDVLAGIKKQEENAGDTAALASLDPALAQMFVPRSEYDSLKQKYDVLLASTAVYSASKPKKAPAVRASSTAISVPAISSPSPVPAAPPASKKRKARPSKGTLSAPPEHGETLSEIKDIEIIDDKGAIGQAGRKRRSIKLEHLVHQTANRRLGVEYLVAGFRTTGADTLPDPVTPAPPVNMSVNGIQEYRPDFTKPVEEADVRAYVDVVAEDAWAAWTGGVGEGETGVDAAKVQEAVETYWIRLQKRWLEQQARIRGEIHKDELTRRKQNQYRRQQSLVGRRVAAFDTSPLNACRLRALYRTLLTIDFAPPTNERPDPTRSYTEDQWYAYRRQQLGGRASLGHEIVDIFWLSPAARTLLILLDAFSAARPSTGNRKKGRPKAPSPVFHLPPSLWDTSPARLPLLRPKDADGLPIPDTPGIILFTFHVRPDVIAQYPAWAAGLYDDPPIDPSDTPLGSLAEVLSGEGYEALRGRVKRDKERGLVSELSDGEVRDILARPEEVGGEDEEDFIIEVPVRSASAVPQLGGGIDYALLSGIDGDVLTEGLEAGLESYVALSQAAHADAEARLALQAASSAGVNVDGDAVDREDGGSGGVGGGSRAFEREGTTLSQAERAREPGLGVRGGAGAGTSIRARKMGKKVAQGPPEGAAMPVAKRQRVGMGDMGNMGLGQLGDGGLMHGHGGEVRGDIEVDAGFLEGL